MAEAIWRPSPQRISQANLTRYQRFLRDHYHLEFYNFESLYNWSVQNVDTFWKSIWEFAPVVHSRGFERVREGETIRTARWFGGARLNFAENLLRDPDESPAIIYWSETGKKRRITRAELYRQVAGCAAALRSLGVKAGDRVAAFVTNCPEAVIMMLAATSLGAIWSSCSPDFGLQGVLDRFRQIEPKVLLAIDGYHYGGKSIDRRETVQQIVDHLPTLEKVVIVPQLQQGVPASTKAVLWDHFIDRSAADIEFEQLEFDHPVYILYSSGTTGAPKCIVHGAGGTLLQHFKEHALHTDLKRGDVLSYFTTCGWMMWNWLVGALSSGVAIFLYDGSPAHPHLNVLWDAVDEEKINVFGTSPKFLQACEHVGLMPRESHRLDSLRAILSTGSPLPEATYEWVYENVKGDLQLSSISGGTDIVSCFMLGAPVLPVYRGEIQTRGLGMKVECFNDNGQPVVDEVGELVCTVPFPSRPIYFWNDPDGSKYRAAYFEHYLDTWRHGDFIKITPHGGVIVYGRSDATLNRAGVRIGTAEIYNPVEAMAEIEDSLVVERKVGDESEIVLFVVPTAGQALTTELIAKIKQTIRTEESPRHVPDRIVAVTGIPRTISGKKVELAVQRILNGQAVSNRDALANPEVLAEYEGIALRLRRG